MKSWIACHQTYRDERLFFRPCQLDLVQGVDYVLCRQTRRCYVQVVRAATTDEDFFDVEEDAVSASYLPVNATAMTAKGHATV